jgi:hypothetical protein
LQLLDPFMFRTVLSFLQGGQCCDARTRFLGIGLRLLQEGFQGRAPLGRFSFLLVQRAF